MGDTVRTDLGDATVDEKSPKVGGRSLRWVDGDRGWGLLTNKHFATVFSVFYAYDAYKIKYTMPIINDVMLGYFILVCM